MLTVIQRMTTKIQPLDPRKQKNQHNQLNWKSLLIFCQHWFVRYTGKEDKLLHTEKHISTCASGNGRCECWESKGSPRSCSQSPLHLFAFMQFIMSPNMLLPPALKEFFGWTEVQLKQPEGMGQHIYNISYKHGIVLVNLRCNKYGRFFLPWNK